MNRKKQIKAINEFLAVLYDQETRFSMILEKGGFNTEQIESLRTLHLEQIIAAFLSTLKQILVGPSSSERLYEIISSRFGLEGQAEETLHTIGNRLGITRERVRQLEKKALRKCRNKINMRKLETSLYNTASQALRIEGQQTQIDLADSNQTSHEKKK